MIRSTLVGSMSTSTGSASIRTGCAARLGDLVHDPARELADVGGLALREQLASVDPVEVEEVVDQAVHLATALLDHLVEARRAPRR